MEYENKGFRGYTLTYKDHEQYCHASVDVTRNDRQTTGLYVSSIARSLDDASQAGLLIEKLHPKTSWIWDTLAIIENFSTERLSKFRVALVDPSGAHFGVGGFGVDLGRGSNAAIRIFSDVPHAEAWLRQP